MEFFRKFTRFCQPRHDPATDGGLPVDVPPAPCPSPEPQSPEDSDDGPSASLIIDRRPSSAQSNRPLLRSARRTFPLEGQPIDGNVGPRGVNENFQPTFPPIRANSLPNSGLPLGYGVPILMAAGGSSSLSSGGQTAPISWFESLMRHEGHQVVDATGAPHNIINQAHNSTRVLLDLHRIVNTVVSQRSKLGVREFHIASAADSFNMPLLLELCTLDSYAWANPRETDNPVFNKYQPSPPARPVHNEHAAISNAADILLQTIQSASIEGKNDETVHYPNRIMDTEALALHSVLLRAIAAMKRLYQSQQIGSGPRHIVWLRVRLMLEHMLWIVEYRFGPTVKFPNQATVKEDEEALKKDEEAVNNEEEAINNCANQLAHLITKGGHLFEGNSSAWKTLIALHWFTMESDSLNVLVSLVNSVQESGPFIKRVTDTFTMAYFFGHMN